MNINKSINKLLYALKQKGEFYKINTFQSYNEKKDKYCTTYQIYKKEKMIIIPRPGYEEKYHFEESFYSKAELVKYLAKEYQKGSEVDG